MKRLLIILTLCVGCIIAADAQSTFTQRLQQSNQGEGKVTVKQSQEIDDLINGSAKATTSSQTTTPRKQQENDKDQTATKQEKKDNLPSIVQSTKRDSTDISDSADDNHKKVMRGQKVNGYRVQVFAGATRVTTESRQRESATRSSRFSPVFLSTFIFILHDGYAAWATTALMRRPTMC